MSPPIKPKGDEMNTTTEAKMIANEILRQLGGRRFIVMTGSKNFSYDTNGALKFQVPSTMTRNRINCVKITLSPMDTYNLDFWSVWGSKIKHVSQIDGIYNENLAETFQRQTGLDVGGIR